MNADNLDLRLLRFRSRRDEYPHALASALLDAGRIPEALEVVQVGLSQSENDGALLVLEGRAWFEHGDLPQAQAALLRAAKVTPRDKEPYRWLAQVLMKRGEPARAVQVLERALQLDPTDRALQQAHMRAQRLSKIASEADHPGGPILSASVPAPPAQAALPAARRPGGALPPAASSALPAPPKAVLPPPPAFAAPRASLPLPPAPRAVTDPKGLAQPGPPRQSAPSPQQRVNAPDPVSDSAPPLELSRPRPPGQDGLDDEPTLATELPEELRTWLDAERSSQEPVLSLSPSSNDNSKQKRSARRVPAPPWEGDDDYEPGVDDSEPTLAVHSAELHLAGLDDSVPEGVIVGEALADEPTQRAQVQEETAPVAEPEQPEQVLAMLRAQGIFEAGSVNKDTTTWVPKKEAPRSGSRIGGLLALAWVLALAGAGGGYYGFMRWLDTRRGDARSLIERAAVESRDGQYESLLAAERHLTQARSLDPKSSAALEALVFVHATRALEAASGEMGYLRNTLTRAKEKSIDPALLGATEALLAAYEGDAQGARAKAEAALKAGGDDARVLFLVGRLYQRAGLPEAGSVLERAIAQDAAFGLAWLARGEIELEAGKVDLAREAFAKARGEDGRELRAELWTIVVDTDAERAPALKQELKALDQRIERGSASDKLLAVSARAGLSLALGDMRERARPYAKEPSCTACAHPS
jgi:tetratricopeptide (TPR) repeat protein